ncbi:MAG: DUF2510 domain-containing protein [Acidimicrobiia bacterium]|nr:DUF2510 domain-containing protein [Acidimicrobiia bacterium]
MHGEATNHVNLVGPGWHPDPLDPSRLRWWDGTSWVARIAKLEAGSDAISWHAAIADLAPPEPQIAAPPVPLIDLTIQTPPAPMPTPAPAELPTSTPVEVAPVGAPAAAEGPRRPHPPRNRRAWAVLGVAVLMIAAGAGVGTAMLGGDARPIVDDRIAYRDDDADFALKYPEEWHVDKRVPGEGINFIVGSTSVPADEQNTVSVVAGTSDGQAAIRLEDLVVSTSADLIARHLVNFRLASATEARLAGAPAFRIEFVDSTTKPEVRVVQYTGRTAGGRPLLVGITVREPRTQVSDEELTMFLASITSS